MRVRAAVILAGALAASGLPLLACVDLFHATDFETLCTASPTDPACDAATDAAAKPDVDGSEAADGAPAHPDFCAWNTAEARKQALRACAWLGACEGPLGESVFGPCVVRAQLAFDCTANPALRPRGEVDAFWGCLSTVASCGDVDRCVFPGGVQDCNEVLTGSSSACGGDATGTGPVAANKRTRVECSGPKGRAVGVEPCVMLGKTCSKENDSTATCSGTAGFDCTTSQCSSSSAVNCTLAGTRTIDRGLDCSGYGDGDCVLTTTGSPSCAPSDAATRCTDEAPPACDGTDVTTCIANRETRVHCNLLGLPCDVSEPVEPSDPSAACVDRSGITCAGSDACEGLLLVSCGRGARFSVNCQKVGLGACKVAANGRAACGAP